ncbi:MAG: adenosine nucleotide hydrolase, partial [Steroidobacteraceae bacterium]
FEAIVVCVNAQWLDASFCGRSFNREFLADLPEGVDWCGENGEFHTFVYASPLMNAAVRFAVTGRREYVSPPQFGSQRFCFAELE